MKVLRATIRSCGDCPFLDVIENHVRVEGGEEFPVGWFCLHKAGRAYVLRLCDSEGMGLRDYLIKKHGRPFPPDCPLPDVQTGRRSIGPRVLDLQPVVRGT